MLDFTTLWAFFKKNDSRLGQLITIAAIFGAGWYIGQITSPLNNATPIIFNDRECSACSSSGGTVEQLQALKEEGQGGSQVAGTVTVASNDQKTFVSSVNSDLYHHYTCSSASRIKEENQEWFATSKEARSAGLKPSNCTEELGF